MSPKGIEVRTQTTASSFADPLSVALFLALSFSADRHIDSAARASAGNPLLFRGRKNRSFAALIATAKKSFNFFLGRGASVLLEGGIKARSHFVQLSLRGVVGVVTNVGELSHSAAVSVRARIYLGTGISGILPGTSPQQETIKLGRSVLPGV